MSWSDIFLKTLKDNDVRLVTYVPDNVLTPLIKGVTSDNYFMSANATREDEAVGMVAGAWMGGLKGCVMMQTSGFALIANALASLVMPFQIPAILLISERGTLGDHQLGQAIVCRTMRPVLQTLGIEHFAIERLEDVEFVVDATAKQAYATQAPAALILSPLLTKKAA